MTDQRAPATSMLRGFLLGASIAAGVAAAGISLATRLSKARLEAERRDAEVSSASLVRRNQQLTALYTVFSQITETLTLKYVVATTVREALKIMGADMVLL